MKDAASQVTPGKSARNKDSQSPLTSRFPCLYLLASTPTRGVDCKGSKGTTPGGSVNVIIRHILCSTNWTISFTCKQMPATHSALREHMVSADLLIYHGSLKLSRNLQNEFQTSERAGIRLLILPYCLSGQQQLSIVHN